MNSNGFHLAQINIARLRAPIDDPLIADFVAQLDEINALADSTPGFVWRLKTDDGNATSIVAYDDPLIIVNMSVWESPQALQEYVYRSNHTAVLRERKKWFEPLGTPAFALWWVPAGHIPTVQEAKERLEILAAHGPTPQAFTFKVTFPPQVEVEVAEPLS